MIRERARAENEQAVASGSDAILSAARERLLRGWCQGSIAQDEDGHAADAWSPDARRWSILGALLASWRGGPVEDLRRAVTAVHASTKHAPLEVWNDRPGRTHDDVVKAFEQAIEAVTGSGAEARPPLGTHEGNGRERVTSPEKDPSAYWLSACDGFRVDSADGRIGIVEEVRFSSRQEPEALAVRVGLFRLRRVVVPVSEVDRVLPQRKRVMLRSAEALIGRAETPPWRRGPAAWAASAQKRLAAR